MSRRHAVVAALGVAALSVSLVSPAVSSAAKPNPNPRPTPAWSPLTPPASLQGFAESLDPMLYAVSCGGATATGWSADVAADGPAGVPAVLVSTAASSDACAGVAGGVLARQADTSITTTRTPSDSGSGLATLTVSEDLPFLYWSYVPMPRINQWVGIGARAADGTALPMLERRIITVDADTFGVDAAIDAAYVGAPVVDNRSRVLGVVTAAGIEITGTPQMCDALFDCADPTRVWWDITAPSAARDVKATPGKGSVRVTWKPAARDGGTEVAYWYRVGSGPWIKPKGFGVTVKARKGQLVTVTVATINLAGPGPEVTVSARAR